MMNNEEMQATMQFILQQQEQFAAGLQKAEELRRKDSARLTRLEESFVLLVKLAESHNERIDSLTEAQLRTDQQLKVLGERMKETDERMKETDQRMKETDERMKETDERLNALITIVERYISKRNERGSSEA